jgi:hypothetical protein
MSIVEPYLDLLDFQRETAFNALDGITNAQLWKPPAPKGWSIGQLLNHNYLLFSSTVPYVKLAWKYFRKRGESHRNRPYQTEIGDVYREPKFPMWVGFLWKPKYSANNPVPFEKLKNEIRTLHSDVRTFYTGKDEDVLGNVFLYDPLFGWINLIVTLRIGIYHDQLHFDDIIKLAGEMGRNHAD